MSQRQNLTFGKFSQHGAFMVTKLMKNMIEVFLAGKGPFLPDFLELLKTPLK